MKGLTFALFLMASQASAQKYTPTSVRDWEKKSDAAQTQYVMTFVQRVSLAEARTYGTTPEDIKNYFTTMFPGRDVSLGMMMVNAGVELMERASHTGFVDMSQVTIEMIIDWAIDQKFVMSGKKNADFKKPDFIRKAKPQNDDPIGDGGFITPPHQ